MAAKCLRGLSAFLVLFLSLLLLLKTLKLYQNITKGASSILLDLRLDKKYFPSRNSPGLRRLSRCRAKHMPSCKLNIGLHLLNASMAASCLIMLAGDASSNPGPGAINLLKARGFTVAHLNTRSIVNKMDDIVLLNQVKPFDIFMVSDTWLNPDISDSEVSLPGYTLARHDRSEKHGGGTAIFIRDGIPYKHRTDLTDSTAETCWIEINRPKCKKLFVCCAYRPPAYCCDSFVDHLNVSLAKLPPKLRSLYWVILM